MNILRSFLHRIRVHRAAKDRKRALTVASAIVMQDAAAAAQAGYHAASKQHSCINLRVIQMTWPDMVASYGLN